MAGKWKSTYAYYDRTTAHRVFKGLKDDGVRVKMTSRKLDATERRKHHGSTRLYTIYRWRI